MSDQSLDAALARAANMTKHPATLREALHDLAESASISVPGIQHAGVWVLDGQGQLRTRAASSDLVWMFDSLSLCEGGANLPGLDPTSTSSVATLHEDLRWSRYSEPATDLGLGAQLTVAFSGHRGSVGGLSLFANKPFHIGPEVLGMAYLYAAHAAHLLETLTATDDRHRDAAPSHRWR